MNTLHALNKVIMDLSFLQEEPLEDSKLKDDLGFDSLKIVELMIAIEDSLGIRIDESDLDPNLIITVADLHNLVKKYTA
jgi:acyl carrier protein